MNGEAWRLQFKSHHLKPVGCRGGVKVENCRYKWHKPSQLVFVCVLYLARGTGFGALRMFLGTLEGTVESSVVQRRLLVRTLWCWYLMLVSGLQWCQRGWNCSCCRSCEKTMPCCEHLGFVDPPHIFRMHPLFMAISQWFVYSKRKGALGQKKPLAARYGYRIWLWATWLQSMQFMRSRCRICNIRTECLAWQRGWMSDGSRQWSDAAGSVTETKNRLPPTKWETELLSFPSVALLGLGGSIPFNDISIYRWNIWVDFSSRKFILSFKPMKSTWLTSAHGAYSTPAGHALNETALTFIDDSHPALQSFCNP